MITILAEKPDVGIKIAAALGGIQSDSGVITFEQLNTRKKDIYAESKKGYLTTSFENAPCRVTWGYGHLCKLRDVPDYDPSYKQWRCIPSPFIPETYEIKPNGRDAASQLKLIKQLFSESDYIINATDFDREGEVIFGYIYQYTKCTKPVKRVCYSSMTKTGFQRAFSNLMDEKDMRPVEWAGRMRGIADWVVGINLTVAMTVHNPGNGVLSVGRVQTPTLRMIVDRELEIQNFKPTPFWTISAVFTTSKKETYKASHSTEKFLTADEVAKEMEHLESHKKEAVITEVKSETVQKWMPHLYSLSTLQMAANSKFNMTLKQTLDTAQSLYSKGLTTYPRTTSQYLTEDMGPLCVKVLNILKGFPQYEKLIGNVSIPFSSKYWFDNSKVDSHFAIIPTGVKPGKLTPFEEKIYDLICKSVIHMLYKPAEVEETKVITDVAGSAFKSSGSVIKDPGWMVVDGIPEHASLPDLSVGEQVTGKFSSDETETKPPKRYSDKTLLAAMISSGKMVDDKELRAILDDPDVAGIGTSATRDSIIETLIAREYIKREKKVFHATKKGIDLISVFPVDVVKSPEMTAKWEKRLNEISKGKEDPETFRRDIEKELRVWCGQIGESPRKSIQAEEKEKLLCPVCGGPLTKKIWGYACTNKEKNCSFTIGKIAGKQLTDNQIQTLLTKGKTGVIAGFKSKAGKSFRTALKWNPETKSVEFDFSAPVTKKPTVKKGVTKK